MAGEEAPEGGGMDTGDPISDEELHAYIDGAGDAARRYEIAVYLATNPAEAARAEAFRAQKEGMNALFVAGEHKARPPVPAPARWVKAIAAALRGRR